MTPDTTDTEAQWNRFEQDLPELADLVLDEFRRRPVPPEEIVAWRTECVTAVLQIYDCPRTQRHIDALTKAVKAKGRLKVTGLEELEIDQEAVNAARREVSTAVLPLYEGKCSSTTGWEPSFITSGNYRSLAESILVERDLPLHPELVKEIYEEIIRRRTYVGNALREIGIGHKRTRVKETIRRAMLDIIRGHKFGEEDDDTAIVMNTFIDKPRGGEKKRKAPGIY